MCTVVYFTIGALVLWFIIYKAETYRNPVYRPGDD